MLTDTPPPNTAQPSASAAAPAASTAPRTLVERAYLDLRQDIISGQLPPGARLRVEHLKDRYEVGAGTLREALMRLVSDALVIAEGQRGFRVTTISLADLHDVTATRAHLEIEALRRAIRQGGSVWEQHLQQAYTRLCEAERRPGGIDPTAWEAANQHFHRALIAAHDSPWSKHLLAILYHQSERYRYVALRLSPEQNLGRDAHREHTDIYQAALARQEARAALALESHIWLTYDLLKSALEANPQAPLAAARYF